MNLKESIKVVKEIPIFIRGSQFNGNIQKEFADEYVKALAHLLEVVKKVDVEKMKSVGIDLIDECFPKGKCKERGQAMVLYTRLLIAICEWLEKGGRDEDKEEEKRQKT